ncbi:MAG: aldo/keto reductase [Ancrocorticia sp.]|uniref:aldo/keto reductase n=1 Tax=Ancrocorticia sp. TaxID=2593684 RepID=UPI003F906193
MPRRSASPTSCAIEAVLDSAAIAPMVNQFEAHPSLQQRGYEAASRKAGMAVEAYSPIGHGADIANPVVEEIAAAHNASPAQVVLAWHLAQDRIVIPKSRHLERMQENFEATKLELGTEDLSRIDALESGIRQNADPETKNS